MEKYISKKLANPVKLRLQLQEQKNDGTQTRILEKEKWNRLKNVD